MANATRQPFRFTGELQEPEVRGTDLGDNGGLYYLRARFYDPANGRFMSRDPWHGTAVLPQTLNRYAYVANNPTNFGDPRGMCRWGLPCPDVPGPVDILEAPLQAGDSALSYVPGWNQLVDTTNGFLYGPYQASGDWAVEHFSTRSCASFALDLGGSAALAFGGPFGVPVAAVLFGASLYIDSSEGDWFGVGSSGGVQIASPLTLDEFRDFAPRLGRTASRLSKLATLYSGGACLWSASG